MRKKKLADYYKLRAKERRDTRDKTLHNFIKNNQFPTEARRKHILETYKGNLLNL